MPWHERDYYRSGPRFSIGRGVQRRSIVFWLITINIGVFVLDAILARAIGPVGMETEFGVMPMGPLEVLGYFSAQTAVYHFQIWRFVTFQFLHAGIGHIFFNMLALYFFGPMIEAYLGSRRFLGFYLLCGMAGATLYIVLLAMHILISAPWVPLVGASAGIFGILIAAARIAPNTTVMLLFPPIPMRLKTLAWIFVGIAAFTIFSAGHNAGGEAAHLGGAALGFLLIRNPRWLNFADRLSAPQLRQLAHDRNRKRQERRHRNNARRNAQVDRILDKVKHHGMHSLTDREKRMLQEATERRRRAG